jgi:hypothetical protein
MVWLSAGTGLSHGTGGIPELSHLRWFKTNSCAERIIKEPFARICPQGNDHEFFHASLLKQSEIELLLMVPFAC